MNAFDSPSRDQAAKRRAARVAAGRAQREAERQAWTRLNVPRSALMLPMLAVLQEEGVASPKRLAELIADRLGIEEAALRETRVYNGKPSRVFEHNVRWAQQTAKQRGWVAAASRAAWRLTDAGERTVESARPGTRVLIFKTGLGSAYVGLAEEAIALVEPGSVQSCFVSPPFPLLKGMPYGTMTPAEWLPWMLDIVRAFLPALSDDGCLAVHLGSARYRGVSAVSSYRERFVIAAQDLLGLWRQADLHWHNPSRLADLQWGGIRGIVPRDGVDPIYILSKEPTPKLSTAEWRAAQDPDGKHVASAAPGGARASGNSYGVSIAGPAPPPIPSSLVAAAQPTSDGWRRALREQGLDAHPCPMPPAVTRAVIQHTSSPGDLVADFFFGSGSTGAVAETLGRRWIGVDRSVEYLRAAALRPEFTAAEGFELQPIGL